MISNDSRNWTLGYFQILITKFQSNIWIGLTVIFKAITQLIVLKSISHYFGSTGIGYLGQVLGCITILNSLLSVGLVNFLVTEISAIEKDIKLKREVYRAVSFWCFAFQLVLIFVAIFFAEHFSDLVFSDRNEKVFFIALAIGFVFFNMSSVTQGFLASQKNVKVIFLATALSSICSIVGFLFIVTNFKNAIPAAALAFYFLQGIVFFGFFIKNEADYISLLKPRFNAAVLKKIIKFVSVMSVTGSLGALQQVYIRSHLIENLGLSWMDVGHWQAIIKISEINLSYIGLTMISLYLPSIALTKNSLDLRFEAMKHMKQILTVLLIVILLLLVFSKYVLLLIFSREFMFLENLLRLQLLGDIFKLSSWIFTYFILCKLPIRLFLGIELLGLGLLTANSIWLSSLFKIDGLIYAQTLTSFLFFIITAIIFNYFSKRDYLWNSQT